MDKYKYTYERTPNYCYPDSDVLINKLGIKAEDMLNQYERRLVAIRQTELIENPIVGNLDFDHLKEIHRYLFQDLYYWAGESRNCNIAKQDLFCLAQHIDSYAESIFSDLKKKQFYINENEDEIIVSLVNFFGDLNALHPFREGNGRSQREFINMLARINGISISFINISAKEMIEASHRINNGDDTFMKMLFKNNFEKLDRIEQLEYIESYLKDEGIKNIFKEMVNQNSMDITFI